MGRVCVQAFVKQLHSSKQYWVPIVDPGIKVDPGYPAYDQGLAAKAFINDFTGKPYLGQVGLALPASLPHLLWIMQSCMPVLQSCMPVLHWAGAYIAENDATCTSLLSLAVAVIWQVFVNVAICEAGLRVLPRRICRLPEHVSLYQHSETADNDMLRCCCSALSYPMTEVLLHADCITHQVVVPLQDQPDMYNVHRCGQEQRIFQIS